MGVEYYVVCDTHIEELWVGGLQFLEPWVRKLVESKNIRRVSTPTPLQDLRREIRKFKERHNMDICNVLLVNDHTDAFLEHDLVYFRSVDYDEPLLTKEEVEKYIVEKRDKLIQEENRRRWRRLN